MSFLFRFVTKNAHQQQIFVRAFHLATKSHPKILTPTAGICHRFLIPRVPRKQSTVLRLFSSEAHHNHSKIWVVEKVLSATLLAVIPAAFLYPNPVLDYALALSLVAHCHWGFEAIVVDYIRPSLVGPIIPKVSIAALYLISIWALAGLFYMNYSDVGLTSAIRMFAKSS